MKHTILSLLTLLSISITNLQAQDCYELLQTHSGINSFYDIQLQDKACKLAEKIVEASATENLFISGADLYPPLAYARPEEGFDYVYDHVFQQQVAIHPAYLFFAKQFSREGEIRVKIELSLPVKGAFQGLTAIEREGLRGYLDNIMEEEMAEESHSPYRVKHAEIRVMEELTGLVQDMIDGNFDLGAEMLELAGFEAIELEPGLNVVLEDVPAFKDSGDSVEKSNGGEYILTSIKLDDGISGPVELQNLVPTQVNLYNLFSLKGLLFTSSDLDSLQQEYGPANEVYEEIGENHDFAVWFHYSLNPEFERFLYFKLNIKEDLAEQIVDAEFVEEMQNWGMEVTLPGFKGDPKEIYSKSGSEWKWGYSLLQNYIVQWYGGSADDDCPDDSDCVSPVLYGASIGCGVFDGMLASIKAIWDMGKGVGNVAGGFIKKTSSYFTELISYGIKERSLWKMHKKFAGDAIDKVRSAVNAVVEVWNTISSIDLSQLKPFLDQIKKAITEWLETLTSYTLEGGYELGKLVFDLVFTVATLGAGSGATGAKFLSKFIKMFDKVKSSHFYNTMKEVLDQSWALTQKGGAAAAKFYRCRILGRGCFIGNTPIYAMIGLMPIQEVELGQWIYSNASILKSSVLWASVQDKFTDEIYDPWVSQDQRWLDQQSLSEQRWYRIGLELKQPDGNISQVKLMRPQAWIDKHDIDLDHTEIWISMPEQGLEGYATVTSLAHFRVSKIPGRADDDPADDLALQPVTGIFIHHSGDVRELVFEKNGSGEQDTLGVTSAHPIYSLDHQDWRLAGELEIGEQVLTAEGEAMLLSNELREGSQTVYNLEVRELHNFLVGEFGVVVHNNCWSEAAKVVSGKIPISDIWKLKIYPQIFQRGNIIEKIARKSIYTKGKGWKYTGKGDGGLGMNNYWLIDFFKGKRVVSVKSTKITDPTDWANNNTDHIRKLSERKIQRSFPNCKPGPNCQNPSHVINNIDEVELHIVVEDITQINKNDWITAIKDKLPVGEKDNLIITISEL